MKILKKILAQRPKKNEEGFFGDHKSWEDARTEAGGYDQPDILIKTELAMREIIAGRASFERDSVLLPSPEYPWPLITCLIYAAQADGNRLSVLDFGGALGSTYYQCRPFLKNISQLAWMVVEQKHYVESGQREFSKGPVSFHQDTLSACLVQKPNFLLLSSVLPYLPNPYEKFQELSDLKIRNLLVDRTFFLRRPGERLTVQVVPEWIYPASYPAWFLDEAKLKEVAAGAGYRLMAEFPALDENQPEGEKADAKGFYWILESGLR